MIVNMLKMTLVIAETDDRLGSLVVVSHISPRLCLFALSVTEAEFYADVLCAQDMLFIMWLLFSLGLDVQHNSQWSLEVSNKGAINFINGRCMMSGRTSRRIDVKQYFLWELKEQGIIKIVYGDLVMRWQVIKLYRTCHFHYLSIMDIRSIV